jgi:hypothetical protein
MVFGRDDQASHEERKADEEHREDFDDCDLRLADFGLGGYRGCDLRGNDLSAISGAHRLRRVVIDRTLSPGLQVIAAAGRPVTT